MFKKRVLLLATTLIAAIVSTRCSDTEERFLRAAFAVIAKDSSPDMVLLSDIINVKGQEGNSLSVADEKIFNLSEVFVLQTIAQNLYAIQQRARELPERGPLLKQVSATLSKRISGHYLMEHNVVELTPDEESTLRRYAQECFIETLKDMSLQEQQACLYGLFIHDFFKPDDLTYFESIVSHCEFFDRDLPDDVLNQGQYVSTKMVRRFALYGSSTLRAVLSKQMTLELISELVVAVLEHNNRHQPSGFIEEIVTEQLALRKNNSQMLF